MSVPLLNAAGRRRAPVTLPGYLAGRPPRTRTALPARSVHGRGDRRGGAPGRRRGSMASACGPSSCCSGGRGCNGLRI
jgi:hypothetical protein